MICKNCGNNRILYVSAKCSDLCKIKFGDFEDCNYVPNDLGIGGGDYVKFHVCLNCGQLQGNFPIPMSETEIENSFSESFKM